MTRKEKRLARKAGRNARYRYLTEAEVPKITGSEIDKGAEADDGFVLFQKAFRFDGIARPMLCFRWLSVELIQDSQVDAVAVAEMGMKESAIEQFMARPPNRNRWPARPYGLKAYPQ